MPSVMPIAELSCSSLSTGRVECCVLLRVIYLRALLPQEPVKLVCAETFNRLWSLVQRLGVFSEEIGPYGESAAIESSH